MHLTLRADKDAYITNRIVLEHSSTGSNVGEAGSLDLFKLYGFSTSGSTPLTELSRLLVHFDLQPLRDLITQGRVNASHGSFACRLTLKDVYGGQTTPSNFTVTCFPLSRSFEEGLGRDVVQYTDLGVCNYVSASRTAAWDSVGCSLGGYVGQQCDYLTSSNTTSLSASMMFNEGTEDLGLDVTDVIRLILTGSIPDSGFRISYASEHEIDQQSYFVKRFGARRAYDLSKRPALTVTWNDSILDDTGLIALDTPLTLFLHNYELGSAANITSGSSVVTGSACLLLRLVTEVSGGWNTLSFTGSQHAGMAGVYSASFVVSSSNAVVRQKLDQTGSYRALPIWSSLDGTVPYNTGSYLTFRRKEASTTYGPHVKYDVSVNGLENTVDVDSEIVVRINLFDRQAVGRRTTRTPINSVGATVRDTHVTVRDLDTGETVVPLDKTTLSSRCSSDGEGMWYRLFTHGWHVGHRFVIDVVTSTNGIDTVYRNASAPFRVTQTT